MTTRLRRLLAVALSPAFLFGLEERRIGDIFKTVATPGDAVRESAIFVLFISAGIFLVVAAFAAYAIFKFRRRPGDDLTEPPQVYGSTQIEIAWTVIPLLIVFVLLGVTARVIAGVQDHPLPKDAIHATVVGHQWWWEIRYTDYGFTTANELHVPVSEKPGQTPTVLRLQSIDVIHGFWVPQLAGKTDVIPNRENVMWFDPRETGIYFGNCSEYCGTQHAGMLLKVIVQPKADFEAWVESQKQAAAQDASAASGRETFESLACVNCHAVRETPAHGGSAGPGKFGPDLTHVASRLTLASGVITNTPEHLRQWIQDPQVAKPGNFMPAMQLTDQQINDVVAYLETLK
jgi:cytochrome c oxidase subunit 2